jgi:hypothetical protein
MANVESLTAKNIFFTIDSPVEMTESPISIGQRADNVVVCAAAECQLGATTTLAHHSN